MAKQKAGEAAEEPVEELRRKYAQFQLLQQYLDVMLEEKAKVDAKVSEVMITSMAMRKLKELPGNQEMWSSFGSDVFVMSDIKNREKVVVGVGAGVFLKKPVDEAVALIDARRAELEQLSAGIAGEALRLQAEIERLGPEIQAMAEKIQSQQPGGKAVAG